MEDAAPTAVIYPELEPLLIICKNHIGSYDHLDPIEATRR